MSNINTCPACNYTRLSSDDAPDWLCPKCMKSYSESARRSKIIDASPLVLILFSLMFLYGGWKCLSDVSHRLVRNIQLVRSGVASTGRVAYYRESPGGRRCIWPVVAFVAPNGETILFESKYHPNYSGYTLGQPVKILFDTKDPHIAEINEPERLWGGMKGSCLVVVLFVTMGGGGLFLSLKRYITKRKSMNLEPQL